MPIDDRTANLSLPKVNVDNNMRLEDVPRLREFADDVDLALNGRPTQASVTSEIGAAVSGLASTGYVDSAVAGRVPTSRTITAGTGLDGTGDLTNDITLSLDSATQTSLAAADISVPNTREVFAGTGLAGGGDLTQNITLSLSAATQTSLGKANTALQPADRAYASDAEMETGTDDTKVVTPAKARHLLDTRPSGMPVKWITNTTNYTILATDNGWFIGLSTGFSGTVTLPNGLTAGVAVTIFNNLATGVTITATGTMLVAGTGATGSHTLGAYGILTAVYTGNDYWILNGAGLS